MLLELPAGVAAETVRSLSDPTLGPALAAILTGSLIVEQIFGLPGIGRYFVQGALNRDYTLVMGVVICYAALIILLNFVADILIAFLDPRVRLT